MKKKAMVLTLMSLMGIANLALRAQSMQQIADQAAKPPRNLATLIFEGVQIIDYTGPYETFWHTYFAGQRAVFNLRAGIVNHQHR